MRQDRRGSAHSRGYGAAWRRLRAAHLAAHPLCVMCRRAGRTTPATVVDHITPHKGDWALLMDARNLQSLCAPHHDSTKQAEERGTNRVDPLNPWGEPAPRRYG